MDIRKYFSAAGGSKPAKTQSSSKETKKKNRIIDSDDEDPLPSANKKQKILHSDSDDDLFEPKKVKTSPKIKKEEKPRKKSLPKPETPKLKPTSASDFFSKAPVRKETTAPAVKKEPDTLEVHSDDEFEKTLKELDKERNKPKVEHDKKPKEEADKNSPKKPKFESKSLSPNENKPPNESDQKGGLASKLSAKLQENKDKDRKEKSHVSKKERDYEITPKKEKSEDRKEKTQSHEKKRKHSEEKNGDKTHEKSDSIHKKKKMSPSKDDVTPKKGEKKVKEGKNEKIKSSRKAKAPLEIEPKEKKDTPKKAEEVVEEEASTPQADEKKNSRAAYFKFLQRAGPSNPGSKLIPEGAPECLQSLVFVVTGVMESLDREQASEVIKKYGGKVTTSVSRNTSYIIVGNEPGESKLKKAEQLGTKVISEDDLLEMIRTRPGKGGAESSGTKENTPAAKKLKAFERESQGSSPKAKQSLDPKMSSLKVSSAESSSKSSPKKLFSPSQSSQGSQEMSSQSSSTSSPKTQPISSQELKGRQGETLMWVDKYKPANLKNIIGQQGDKSNVKKLLSWLKNWKKNQFGGKKLARPGPWVKDDSGAFFKCALLSGPPGVGKTTTAHLVCKEAGLDFVELNASDARSKRRLDEVVAELLSNKNLAQFGASGGAGRTSEDHALVMDEVDGMSGNEDRGGVQQLIALIKKSKIPIIAMCNDRNHPKIRSLANHCFDLRFYKPRIEQIRGPMMSVCFREGIKIKPDALDQIIIGANQDVRQILHHLSVWSANQQNLGTEDMKKEANKAKKDFKMGPWDVCKKVFSASDHKNMSLYDKSDLFFHDYSIAPLFVQENYPKCVPHSANGNRQKTLEQMSKTAESIADGDLCERAIRSSNAWALLPTQAMYSSVLPGEFMSGHMSMQIEFPKWLGNNSRRNKYDRLMQELQMHMRLRVSGTKLDVNMEYCEPLKNAVVGPLAKSGVDGVKDSVEVMNAYHLLREDLDSILELTQWPGSKDIMSKVDSKVKAAFTRAYNKEGNLTPFAAVTVAKKKKGGGGGSGDMYGEEEEGEQSEEEEEDITKNAMIKVKKVGGSKATKEAGGSKGKGRGGGGSSSRGTGRGRGKK